MLLRFIIGNFLSYKDPTEFNTFPAGIKTKNHHKHTVNGVESLKVSAIYGANGAGKSNFVKAIDFLVSIVREGGIHSTPRPFKLKKEYLTDRPSSFEIEFFTGGTFYYYEIEIKYGVILKEALYRDSHKPEPRLIYERITEEKSQKHKINFGKKYLKTEKDRLRIEIIQNEQLEPDELLLSYRWRNVFEEIDTAHQWLSQELIVITPSGRPEGLVYHMLDAPDFSKFLKSTICALDTGIKELKIETLPLEKLYGEDDKAQIDNIRLRLADQEEGAYLNMRSESSGQEIVFERINNQIVAHKLITTHLSDADSAEKEVPFDLDEESDGTKRLFDLLPMAYGTLYQNSTFIVDELERSIHPALALNLLSKILSQDIKGQLIFTTHESTLLDLDIFRQDEIWFSEKNKEGATTLYPLSDFKPRFDLDIRKGYLNGRFGAIPYLGDLNLLKWEEGNEEEPSIQEN